MWVLAKNCRLILDMFLRVSIPPLYYMRKGLKDHKGDIFTVGRIVDKEITL